MTLHISMHKITIKYLAHNLATVIGLVLVWRGICHFLDGVDALFFAGNHFWTAIPGVILGLIILYLPDKDLKEIEKL